VSGIDDYKCIEEILRRRYTRVIEERLTPPDLIIIDGGKAHLSCAEKILKEFGLDIPVLAIAKPHSYVQGQEKEKIFISNRSETLDIPLESLHLILRIRDEAHRFAIKYHHLLRRKKIFGD
jgi:excinuclease ABC subunit C